MNQTERIKRLEAIADAAEDLIVSSYPNEEALNPETFTVDGDAFRLLGKALEDFLLEIEGGSNAES